MVLDEMVSWEQEVFEKEYSDLNWFKGKQAKHVRELQSSKKQDGLGGVFFFCCCSLSDAQSLSEYSVDRFPARYF